MSSARPAAAAPITIAAICASAMIATQVAGKTARDALFLTNFPVSALPLVLIAAAVLSIFAALLTARAITTHGPARIVPPLFIASALLLLVEWWLASRNARPAAIIVYLHIASLGSILISGFWSLIDEAFDPRTARAGIGRIIGGATAGGLFGGFLAERIGALAGILWILPFIAALHLACGLMLARFSHDNADTHHTTSRHRSAKREESGFSVLRRAPYLRALAMMVLFGNIAATLLDYLFKARAASSYPEAHDLVRFFAVFYTVVSVFTLAVQTGMSRRLLESIGIANTVAVRPGAVTIGGLVTLTSMGLLGVGMLRAGEMVLQSSLFRSGYELLFTPVVPDDKRRTKTIVDVGADRMGDIVGAALIRAVILLPVVAADYVLVALAVAISLLSLGVARMLHRGYVRALEASLLHRGEALELRTDSNNMRTLSMESFTGIDLSMTESRIPLEELRTLAGVRVKAAGGENAAPQTDTGQLMRVSDPEITSLAELRSGNPRRIHAELARSRVITPMMAAQLTTLLAWDEVSGWASRALAKAAPSITGQLVDRMLDPEEDFAVRRRIPQILSTCPTRRSIDGLMAALSDERFEVRYQAARAMSRINQTTQNLIFDSRVVYAAVQHETSVDRRLWNEQRVIDEPDAGSDAGLVEPALRNRGGRRMEHVFNLLSLVVASAPLRIAYKGLLTDDAILRGTGLEYLESVLPREIWNGLYPHLDATGKMPASGGNRDEALEKLLRSSHSIDVNLEEIKKLAEQGDANDER